MDIGEEWAQAGARALRDDRPTAAAAALRRSIVLSPVWVDSLSNLAACAQRLGQEGSASDWLQRLLTIADRDVEALVALASVHPAERIRERSLRRAAALSPGSIEGWTRIGAAAMYRSAGESLAAFRRALVLSPLSASAWIGEALALGRFGRREASARGLRRGLTLEPGRLDGWDALADPTNADASHRERLQRAARSLAIAPRWAAGWHRLGGSHWGEGRAGTAALCYRRALALEPQLVEAVANLGAALRELGRQEDVLTWFRRAVVMAPDSGGAMTNLGTAMPPGATDAFLWHRRALVREPSHIHALNNLGSQHLARNELEEAVRWFDRALIAGYADGEAQWNRGVSRLLLGDLVKGFADYEHRWQLRAFMEWRRGFEAPLWQGEPGGGRTILAHAEQGLGDTIQCVRYLEALADRGFRVVLECQPSLVRLLVGVKGVAAIVAKGAALPPFDTHVPLLSLPHRFGTTLSTVPARTPYLAAPKGVRSPGTRRIGLVWAGNPEHKNDRNRSLDQESFRRLATGAAALPDVTLTSLQVGSRAADLARLELPAAKVAATAPFSDFADTAAAIMDLDLVIGVDTSVMHLTGALGRPGWLLVPFAPDWRWLIGRSDTPWYPSLRLYRQPAPGDWMPVIEKVLEDLRVP